jgi:hypothetical protein
MNRAKMIFRYKENTVFLIGKLTFVFAMLYMLSACAVVQPWEREHLSDPIMMFDDNPIEKGVLEHHLNRREGSDGGTGSQSGGCGCG